MGNDTSRHQQVRLAEQAATDLAATDASTSRPAFLHLTEWLLQESSSWSSTPLPRELCALIGAYAFCPAMTMAVLWTVRDYARNEKTCSQLNLRAFRLRSTNVTSVSTSFQLEPTGWIRSVTHRVTEPRALFSSCSPSIAGLPTSATTPTVIGDNTAASNLLYALMEDGKLFVIKLDDGTDQNSHSKNPTKPETAAGGTGTAHYCLYDLYRGDGAAFVPLSDSLLVGGGWGWHAAPNPVLRRFELSTGACTLLCDASTWTAQSAWCTPLPVIRHCTVGVGRAMYVIGGSIGERGKEKTNRCMHGGRPTNPCLPADLPSVRVLSCVCSVLTLTGVTGFRLDLALPIQPSSAGFSDHKTRWCELPSLQVARDNASAVLFDGMIVVCGGQLQASSYSRERMEPGSGQGPNGTRKSAVSLLDPSETLNTCTCERLCLRPIRSRDRRSGPNAIGRRHGRACCHVKHQNGT